MNFRHTGHVGSTDLGWGERDLDKLCFYILCLTTVTPTNDGLRDAIVDIWFGKWKCLHSLLNFSFFLTIPVHHANVFTRQSSKFPQSYQATFTFWETCAELWVSHFLCQHSPHCRSISTLQSQMKGKGGELVNLEVILSTRYSTNHSSLLLLVTGSSHHECKIHPGNETWSLAQSLTRLMW